MEGGRRRRREWGEGMRENLIINTYVFNTSRLEFSTQKEDFAGSAFLF